MVLVCPCAALTEGLVSLYIVCMCVNCLTIYYINLIVFFVFVLYFNVLLTEKKIFIKKNNNLLTHGILFGIILDQSGRMHNMSSLIQMKYRKYFVTVLNQYSNKVYGMNHYSYMNCLLNT